MIEIPPGFVIRTEASKAAYHNGFRLERGVRNGWIGYASTTASGEAWIAGASDHGPWLLSVTHPGVAVELGFRPVSPVIGPGVAAFAFTSLTELYSALDRAYRLGLSLPDHPLTQFETQTKGLPRTTEAERLRIERIGQDIFRRALLGYWNGRCPLTGVSDASLLRASHIVRWADCLDDAHRLDVHNGLLLSALWDAAFDSGTVSFADDGSVLVSPALSHEAQIALKLGDGVRLQQLTGHHHQNLKRHREKYGF